MIKVCKIALWDTPYSIDDRTTLLLSLFFLVKTKRKEKNAQPFKLKEERGKRCVITKKKKKKEKKGSDAII